MAYRCYITDIMKHVSGAQIRYVDIAKTRWTKAETRTPEDIVGEIRRKLNGLI